MLKTAKTYFGLFSALLVIMVSGCGSGSTQVIAPATAQASQQVIIYHAGSLTAAFDNMTGPFRRATGIQVVHKGMGSVEAAKRVTVGKETADIYASADYTNIDSFLKPTYADYTIQFAQGQMVLAYKSTAPGATLITSSTSVPPYATLADVPIVNDTWVTAVTASGVKVGGADPNADPGGYRAFMIMQLAALYYPTPNTIYADFKKNHVINATTDKLGVNYDYTFTYEHSAQAAAKKDPTYRYVHLPADINLGDPARAAYYHQASMEMAGLTVTDPTKTIYGTRATWGLTILKSSPHPDAAQAFLKFMFSAQGIALQSITGPDPINITGPAVASLDDWLKLPAALQDTTLIGKKP
ncbi:MAG: extracellular solute-binding protein [Desulfuromonadales bacterium]|nr:extracellular solute-binding protein [Desulfuromonadales bacterium]